MKKIYSILRKCKSFSRQLARSSSYSSLRSKSTKEDTGFTIDHKQEGEDYHDQTIFVGKTRKRYVISSKYLSHPLVSALTEKMKHRYGEEEVLVVRCEVVLFDHLLWMLENAAPNLSLDSLEELADLYVV